ncbi:hypothetical protein BJ170DRAFT_447566 [Xylariales sp. AK1849]|nr:hypothetical protein BJ170DRAFT_447566 [Xylariales sp. AK1849]
MDNNSQYSVVKDTVEETVVDFDLGSLSVRLMNAKDIDLRLRSPYNHTARAKASLGNGIRAFGEPEMSVRCQQYVMARLVSYGQAKSNERETYDSPNDEIDITKNALRKLRADAQEHFWLHMMPHERDLARIAATCYDAGLQTAVDAIKSAWDPKWNNSHWDVDFFYQYKQDRESAEKVWELGDKDVFIVTDRSNRVVFANLEKATQLMYGQGTADTLVRALDLWSYFTALPAPESCRHVVDQYIRRLHPELDPRKVPVVQLPHAKMAVAHYECWSRKGDPNGTIILRTRDASFNRSEDQDWSRMRFPKFAKAVFGKATSIARLLVRNLDPAIYSEGVDIFKNLPEGEKVETDQEDFASLFSLLVNGYTQRHRDISDIRGGLAALITLGSYTGNKTFPSSF